MFKAIGNIGVLLCVFGGYVLDDGNMKVLYQPFEWLMIGGSACMAYLVANSRHTVKQTFTDLKMIYKKDKYGKEQYIELLGMLFTIFKTARQKGWLALERHIEEPEDSDLFKKFPSFYENHHALTFLCDYLRLISLGAEKPHEVEALMDQEIDTEIAARSHTAHAVQTMADGMPALGIVAAVLGVIHTMGSITEPPAVLGHLIGGALCGTFMGVFLSYGFVAPTASAIQDRADTEIKYLLCIKTCVLAFLQGAAPQVAIEFGRKILMHDVQPTFLEVEEATQNLTAAA
ncbi:MAG: flagellar motor stator protein MotA [Alphaproteobacteria bacterium]|nr:flagellar motor stator protein MotA [Alphaproteobacteria bacterium]MDE2337058.1 flagellar motor stator protein MotA [Alphaproteobacteria bacterium]